MGKPPPTTWRSLFTVRPLYTLVIFFLDILGLALAFSLTSLWKLQQFHFMEFLSLSYVTLFGVVFLTFYIFDLYGGREQGLRLHQLLERVLIAMLLSTLAIISLSFLLGGQRPLGTATGRIILIGSFSIFGLWATLWRALILNWLLKQSKNLQWLVFGHPHTLHKLWEDFKKAEPLGQMQTLLPRSHLQNSSHSFPVLGSWRTALSGSIPTGAASSSVKMSAFPIGS